MPQQQGIMSAYQLGVHTHANATQGGQLLAPDNVNMGIDHIMTTSKARAYLNNEQSNIPNTTSTKVLLDAETYDPANDFDADGVDSEYIAPVTGWYLVGGIINWNATVLDKDYRAYIFVNGASVSMISKQSAFNLGMLSVFVSDIVYVVAGQAIDLRGWHNAGVATPDINDGEDDTWLSIHLLSVA